MLRAIGVLSALAVMAGPARGQSDDGSAIAEQLHIQARNLATAGMWPEACAKLDDSVRYAPLLGTRLELAACFERIGKLAAAWSQYRTASAQAAQGGDTAQHDAAQRRAELIEPRLAKLVITPPAQRPAGFAVTRDGAVVDAAQLGAAVYVDPGRHEIMASAPGFAVVTRVVTSVAGKTETLALPALVVAAVPPPEVVAPAPSAAAAAASPAPPASPAAPVPLAATSEPAAPSQTRKYLGIAIGAAGVASLGVGLVFGLKASSIYSDAKALCGESLACAPADYDRGAQLIADTRSHAAISTALVVGGGVAIAGGVILLLTAPRSPERATALVPTAHARGAGVAVVGRF